MQIKWPRKLVSSVFVKLLMVIVVTGFCINFVVAGFFWAFHEKAGRPFLRSIGHYVHYLIADLGSPPQLERAQLLAEQAGLEIHYDGSQASWSTSGVRPERRFSRFRWRPINSDVRVAMYRGHPLIEVRHDAGRFLIKVTRQHDMDQELTLLLIFLFCLLGLILAGAFFSIRWILKPIRWLDEGVKQVSRGNLQHRVPLKRSDELHDLSAAFNDMTDRIREMLQAKEQLLLDISHEMRSPLTRIKVALELIPDNQAKSDVRADIDEMDGLISEILDTARLHHRHGKLDLKRVNLSAIIREIVSLYESNPPGVVAQDLPDLVEADVDPDQFKIVLNNVVSNAIKFSKPDSQPVVLTLVKQSSQAVVEIKDDGVGIPPSEIPFVFEPFYRVDKSRSKRTGGYGLGLSLCKTIMRAHHGKIDLNSREGRGTVVVLSLPLT